MLLRATPSPRSFYTAIGAAGRTREDARAYAVKLTDEGWRVLRAAEPLAKRVDKRVLDALPIPHREQFIAALLAIVSTLEVMAPQGKQRAA